MAKPFTFHVVVADLDALRSQRHERQVRAGVPAGAIVAAWCAFAALVGGPIPGMAVEGGDERLQLADSCCRLAIGKAPMTPTDARAPSSRWSPSNSEPIAVLAVSL